MQAALLKKTKKFEKLNKKSTIKFVFLPKIPDPNEPFSK